MRTLVKRKIFIIVAAAFLFAPKLTHAAYIPFSFPITTGGTTTQTLYDSIGVISSTTLSGFIRSYIGTFPDNSNNSCAMGVTYVGDFDLANPTPYHLPDFFGHTGSCAPPVAAGDYWLSVPIGSNTYYATFHFDGISWNYTDYNKSQFLSETWDPGSGYFTILSYITANDFSNGGASYKLTVSTPGYSVWHQPDIVVATSSGFFRWSELIPQPTASTSIISLRFDGYLFGASGTCNPFNPNLTPNCTNGVVLDTFSTTTNSGFFEPTASTVINGVTDNCTPFSSYWSVSLCLNYLFIPSPSQINSNITNLKNEFLSRVPVGYVTRFYNILASSSNATLPSIAYTFGSTSAFYSGIHDIHFDPFGTLLDPSSIIHAKSDQVVQKTAWEIMEVPVRIVCYLALIVLIIRDVLGVDFGYTVTESGTESVSSTEVLPSGDRKTFRHTISKRRRL